MADRNPPLLEDASRELAELAAEVKQMVELRRRLAVLELHAAAGQIKRLAIAVAVAVAGGLTALPLLAVDAAELLDQRLGVPRSGWLLILGLGLLTAAILGGWLAVRRFRRGFVGLEETLEEFREDLAWLEESLRLGSERR